MKRVLIVSSVISFIEWFNKENIDYLHDELKCEVHVACNLEYFDDTDVVRTKNYIESLRNKGVILHNICFARSPLRPSNFKAFKRLKSLIDSTKFDLVHCHTPAASMLTRLAAKKARKAGTIVMYTCHGFHFHKASPKKNWLVYYPVEKWLSRYCDYLITINREDWNRAKTFHCKNVRYIPGVGVDLNRIRQCQIDKSNYRQSIGVPKNAILLLSIGELIDRKNHKVIIKALGQLKNDQIYYVICGKGPLKEKLTRLASKYHVSNRVIFLGFRKDIPELCNVADISAFPSKIEGLGLAGIEALAAGVPLVASNVHGIVDYALDGITGFCCEPNDYKGFAKSINKLLDPAIRAKMKEKCIESVKPYDMSFSLKSMWKIYDEVLIGGQNGKV